MLHTMVIQVESRIVNSVMLSLYKFAPHLFVEPPLSVCNYHSRPAQRVNINLVRIKVLINREPSKLHSTRAEYTV